MTSYEILKANVLDILFENRNKAYGAYELRTHYRQRMGIALGVMLSSVFIIALLVNSFSKDKEVLGGDLPDNIVRITEIAPDIPKAVKQPKLPPSSPRPNVAQRNFTNRIEFVPDDVLPDMPTNAELERVAISTQTTDGTEVSNHQPSINNNPLSGQGNGTTPEETSNNITILEKNAKYPGGQEAWLEFLRRHLRTPDELEAGQKRTVLVRFAVGVDGFISQFEVVQSGGVVFDKEVIRVLKKMPKWEPAVQNGHNVSVMFTQPVTFMAFEE